MIHLDSATAIAALAAGGAGRFMYGVAKIGQQERLATPGVALLLYGVSGIIYFAGLALLAQSYLNAR